MSANPYEWKPDAPNFKQRGQHVVERKANQKAVRDAEKLEKAKVRKRDKPCRWPHCNYIRNGYRPEVAHLFDKGMGGDHGIRTSARLLMRLCYMHHQGPVSLHSGDLRVEFDTEQQANGRCSFFSTDDAGKEYLVARELAVNGPYDRHD